MLRSFSRLPPDKFVVSSPISFANDPSRSGLDCPTVALNRRAALVLANAASVHRSHLAFTIDPQRAYADGRPIAIGVFGRKGRRNAPALINRGYGRLFFWDGRAASLEEQVLKPVQDRANKACER